MRKLAAAFFIGSGILSLAFSTYLIWQRNTPKRLAFHVNSLPVTVYQTQLYPTTLVIKNVQIELPIVTANGPDTNWETTAAGVSYLVSSPLPGEKGNSLLYGHNWSNLLGNLVKTQPGDEVAVVMNDGSVRQFIVKYTVEVTPDQTHILSQSEDPRLTVYTCSGFLDSKRFVVVATPKLSELTQLPSRL